MEPALMGVLTGHWGWWGRVSSLSKNERFLLAFTFSALEVFRAMGRIASPW